MYLKIALGAIAVGSMGLLVFAGLSYRNQRHLAHVPREEDQGPDDPVMVKKLRLLVQQKPVKASDLVACNAWLDRNGWIIGRAVFFYVCLQLLRALIA